MSLEEHLLERYAPGEDVAPLARALGGGLLGLLFLIAVYGLIPTAAPGNLAWPYLVASVTGSEQSGAFYLAIGVGAATASALVFVYGQFRRFVPGEPWVAGAVWALSMWVLLAPMLLPLSVRWIDVERGAGPGSVLIAGTGLMLETVLGLALYGIALGHFNPRTSTRDHELQSAQHDKPPTDAAAERASATER